MERLEITTFDSLPSHLNANGIFYNFLVDIINPILSYPEWRVNIGDMYGPKVQPYTKFPLGKHHSEDSSYLITLDVDIVISSHQPE